MECITEFRDEADQADRSPHDMVSPEFAWSQGLPLRLDFQVSPPLAQFLDEVLHAGSVGLDEHSLLV